MAVTIRDVAKLAEVSIKTVSNVVRGQGNFSVATKERVERAIETLGYHPNLAARGLRSGRLGVIGLVVPVIRNPYFAELADAVMRVCAEHDLIVVIEQSDGDRSRELDLLTGRATRMVDGLLFSAYGVVDADDLGQAVPKPVVLLGEPVPGWNADAVSMQHVDGARQAAQHLIAQGRQRIAVVGAIGARTTGPASLRLEGVAAAFAEAGMTLDPELVVAGGLWDREEGSAAVSRLAERGVRFDAVLAFNDTLAFGVMRALEARGLRVPVDVAVTGFDDVEESRFTVPSLTTVRADTEDMARTAVRFLLERIDGTAPEGIRVHRASCELRPRASSTTH